MITLEEIKKQAVDTREIFKKCNTLEDLRNLRHLGYQEYELQVEVIENDGLIDLSDALVHFPDWDNTSFSIVRASTNNKNLDFSTTFGINLDLPYILNEMEYNSLTKEQISKLSRQFESTVDIMDNMIYEATKSGIISLEYSETIVSKIQNNIDLLVNNWDKICSKLANYNYEQNKEDNYDYEP